MQNLTAASRELFSRSPDECFGSLDSLYQHCLTDRDRSEDRWHSPVEIRPVAREGKLALELGSLGTYQLNDWSFSQVCKLASVSKDTLNKLSPDTASRALLETLPCGEKPLQVLSLDRTV